MTYNNNIQQSDVLKYATENGIINLDDVMNNIKIMQREKILKQHPYKIWRGTNGMWYTYLPDEKKGRLLKKRKTEAMIKDVIIEYYKKKELNEKEKCVVTFKIAYDRWLKYHSVSFKSPNTIIKYQTEYKRFFENRPFENKNIAELNEEDIKEYIILLCKELFLSKKACKTLYGFLKNTFKSAKIHKDINENPCDDLEPQYFYQFCTVKHKTIAERTVSNQEFEILYKRFYEDYKVRPNYIPTYAVEFASLTGFRVSEISALQWSDFSNGVISVNKSEKYNRQTKEYYIGKTKNERERYMPLTDEIIDLVTRLYTVEKEYGYLCDFVFSNEKGKIHSPTISSCARNKCIQLGIPCKSIHAYRRTFSSKLKCNGLSTTIVASLLGHTEEVNEQYYTYDVSDMGTKQESVQMVTKEIAMSRNRKKITVPDDYMVSALMK